MWLTAQNALERVRSYDAAPPIGYGREESIREAGHGEVRAVPLGEIATHEEARTQYGGCGASIDAGNGDGAHLRRRCRLRSRTSRASIDAHVPEKTRIVGTTIQRPVEPTAPFDISVVVAANEVFGIEHGHVPRGIATCRKCVPDKRQLPTAVSTDIPRPCGFCTVHPRAARRSTRSHNGKIRRGGRRATHLTTCAGEALTEAAAEGQVVE